jgi:hypothetical protein
LLALALCLRYDRGVKSAAAVPDAFARVYAKRGTRALARVAAAFGLNKAETGRLFGVSRQAIDEWYLKGVPLGRIADVSRVADLADALHRRFKPERLPQIVRAPLPGLADESILKALCAHGTVPVFDLLDRAFSYAPR